MRQYLPAMIELEQLIAVTDSFRDVVECYKLFARTNSYCYSLESPVFEINGNKSSIMFACADMTFYYEKPEDGIEPLLDCFDVDGDSIVYIEDSNLNSGYRVSFKTADAKSGLETFFRTEKHVNFDAERLQLVNAYIHDVIIPKVSTIINQ